MYDQNYFDLYAHNNKYSNQQQPTNMPTQFVLLHIYAHLNCFNKEGVIRC